MSRWTFVFLVLHNLTAIASFGATVAARVPSFNVAETASIVHRSLDEAKLLLLVLAVPFSYIIAALANCCCGVDDESDQVEMDKIYSDVRISAKKRRNVTFNSFL